MIQLLIKTQKEKGKFGDNHFHKISDFLLFYQIFLSPQLKRCAIIAYKHGIYELPHELTNDLGIKILES